MRGVTRDDIVVCGGSGRSLKHACRDTAGAGGSLECRQRWSEPALACTMPTPLEICTAEQQHPPNAADMTAMATPLTQARGHLLAEHCAPALTAARLQVFPLEALSPFLHRGDGAQAGIAAACTCTRFMNRLPVADALVPVPVWSSMHGGVMVYEAAMRRCTQLLLQVACVHSFAPLMRSLTPGAPADLVGRAFSCTPEATEWLAAGGTLELPPGVHADITGPITFDHVQFRGAPSFPWPCQRRRLLAGLLSALPLHAQCTCGHAAA
jgi:hypothetical protein